MTSSLFVSRTDYPTKGTTFPAVTTVAQRHGVQNGVRQDPSRPDHVAPLDHAMPLRAA
jgi:hypothetical protein